MRLSGVLSESVTDGPGIRFVLFAQGCPHRCENCHNPETWSSGGGQEVTVRKIERQITRSKKKYRGITLSGGEPFLQAAELAQVAACAKRKGWDVVTFTGYLYEELAENPDDGVQALLELSDILIDGPFVHNLRDTTLPFRGSSNQRVIDLNASRKSGTVVLLTTNA